MKIHLLGTGPAEADRERHNTSLLLHEGGRSVLVDCSGSPGSSILRCGYSLESVEDLVLTHAHPDHMYAVPSLIHCLWLEKGIEAEGSLRIYGFPSVLEVARSLVKAFRLEERPGALQIEWHGLSPAAGGRVGEIDLGGWGLRYFRVTHGSMEALGLEMSNGPKRVVYSADAIADKLMREQLAQPTDLLLHDCGGGIEDGTAHAGARGIGRLLAGGSVQHAVLVHLASRPAEELEELVQVAKGASETEVRIGLDGDVLVV